jgi:hypothetical protein
MSAFIVSKSHIDALISVAAFGPSDRGPRYPGDGWIPPQYRTEAGAFDPRVESDAIGCLLWLENLTSVSYRYGGEQLEMLPGPIGLTADDFAGYRHRNPRRRPTAIEALKLLASYEYQSCEHPGWHESAAHRFVLTLRATLIGALPGYDEASWEWDVA